MPLPWNEWLRRLRHDLLKRLLWPAHDRRDMGGEGRRGELAVALVDDEGNPTTPETVWALLRADAPAPAHPALAAFEPALLEALAASRRDDVPGVLALEESLDRLAEELAKEAG
jgi:hypothetical protein